MVEVAKLPIQYRSFVQIYFREVTLHHPGAYQLHYRWTFYSYIPSILPVRAMIVPWPSTLFHLNYAGPSYKMITEKGKVSGHSVAIAVYRKDVINNILRFHLVMSLRTSLGKYEGLVSIYSMGILAQTKWPYMQNHKFVFDLLIPQWDQELPRKRKALQRNTKRPR